MEKWKIKQGQDSKGIKLKKKTWNGGLTTEEENQWHYGLAPRLKVKKTETCTKTSTCSWQSYWIGP
jgi:hypothetical protein